MKKFSDEITLNKLVFIPTLDQDNVNKELLKENILLTARVDALVFLFKDWLKSRGWHNSETEDRITNVESDHLKAAIEKNRFITDSCKKKLYEKYDKLKWG